MNRAPRREALEFRRKVGPVGEAGLADGAEPVRRAARLQQRNRLLEAQHAGEEPRVWRRNLTPKPASKPPAKEDSQHKGTIRLFIRTCGGGSAMARNWAKSYRASRDFMFKLTPEETMAKRSRIATASKRNVRLLVD